MHSSDFRFFVCILLHPCQPCLVSVLVPTNEAQHVTYQGVGETVIIVLLLGPQIFDDTAVSTTMYLVPGT